MTKTQTILTTLLLACIINSKILVLDMEDLRQLSASKNPNLLRSLLTPAKAAHKGFVCYDRDGFGWIGGMSDHYFICMPKRCLSLENGQPNTRTITCEKIN